MPFDQIIWNAWCFLLIIVCAGSVLALAAIPIVFWIKMLIDCINRDFHKPVDKVIWFLVVFFGNLFGAILYYYCVKTKK